MTKQAKRLDGWPETSEETLELIERFDRLQKKHADSYDLSLSLFRWHVSLKEVDAVLEAEDKLAAAGELCSAKINRWD